IWNMLQRRGFRYSNITTTSSVSDQVYSQYVRPLSESIRTSQANCIDGSVLFASVLRKIGLDVMLVLMPNHCLVLVFLDQQHKQPLFLETTMLGHADLKRYDEDGTLGGALSHLFGAATKNEASYQSFIAATQEGAKKVASVPVGEAQNNPFYQLIDIAQWRQKGIMPIGR